MICVECSAAGVANSVGSFDSAVKLHNECKGDCPCRHKTGRGYVKQQGEKVPMMQTQSP